MYHNAFDSPLVQFQTTLGCRNTSHDFPFFAQLPNLHVGNQLILVDTIEDPSYSKWKFRWSGSKPSTKSLEVDSMEQLVPSPNLVITTYYDFTKHLLASRRYDQRLIDAGLVLPLSLNSIPTESPLSDNAFEKLEKTYYTEYALMSAVRLFFNPKPFLQQEISSFLEQWREFHLIGMQIRMGSGGADFRDTHRFLHLSALDRFIHLAEEYRNSRGYSSSQVKWFLSTDSTDVERKLASQFPGRVVTMTAYRRGHSSPEKANRDGYYRAVLDVSVLSRCEFMVLTNHSSFGMIARMLAKEPAFAIVPAIGY